MNGRLLLLFVFAVLVALFAVENAAAVPVRYPGGLVMASLALVIVAAMAVGAALTIVLTWWGRFSRRRREEQAAELRRLRDELAAARATSAAQAVQSGQTPGATGQGQMDASDSASQKGTSV